MALFAGCGGGSGGTPTPQAPSAGAGRLQRYQDRLAGFAITYPASWHRVLTTDPGVQLRVGPDDRTTASVRIIPYPGPADPGAQKALIDDELKRVKVIDENALSINGLSGWQAIYGVEAPAGLAVHIHVFLFEPTRIHTLVFETLNRTLGQYAASFDQVRESYQALRPAAASPTSAPGAQPGASPTS